MQHLEPATHKFRDRPARQVVDEIVLHGTESFGDQTASRNSLARSGEDQSIHYWIGRDFGLLYSIVPENKQAFHAGNPKHHPTVENHNPRSSGIEMYQRDISILGNDASRLDFTDWQYDTVAMLVFDIRRRWNIKKEKVVAHKRINSEDRADPRNFDWDGFNRRIERISTIASLVGSGFAVT